VTPTSCDILLVSVNARFSHCAYAVRSLQANLGRLSESAAILETDLAVTPFQLASQIAELQPRIVSFSLYCGMFAPSKQRPPSCEPSRHTSASWPAARK